MEDYSKENLEKIYSYANKILDQLEKSADKKNNDLEDAKRRFDNLRGNLQAVLNNTVK